MVEAVLTSVVVLFFIILVWLTFLVATFVHDPDNVRNITNWVLSNIFSPDRPKDPFAEWTQTFNQLQIQYRKYISVEDFDKASEVLNLIERHKLTMPPVPWYKFKRIK